MNSKIYILITSSRPHWLGRQIAKSIAKVGSKNSQIHYKIVDLEDYNLPFIRPRRKSTKSVSWYRKLDDAAGFIFVTPVQNDKYPDNLQKALSYLRSSWKDKPVGFVSYGYLKRRIAIKELAIATSALDMLPVAEKVELNEPWKFMSEKGEVQLPRSQQNKLKSMIAQIGKVISREHNVAQQRNLTQ